MNMKLSLKGKILIPLLITLIIAFIAMMLFISTINSKALKNDAMIQSETMLESTSSIIHSYFTHYRDGLILLTKNDQLIEAATRSVTTPTIEVDAIFESLLPFTEIYDGVTNVYISLNNGRTIAAPVNDVPAHIDPRDRPWYVGALEAGDTVIGEPYVDAISNEKVITVSQPLYSKTNQFLGVVGTDISLAYLIGTLSTIDPGYEGDVFVVNANGHPIVHKTIEEENLFEHPSYSFLGALDASDFTVNSEQNGNNLVVYKKIEGLQWIVGSDYEMKNINAIANSTTKILLITFTVVLIIITALMLFIVSHIIRPITALEKVAKQLATGDLTAKLQATTKDEVGSLATAFGDMVNKTSGTIHNIKQSVHQLSLSSNSLTAYSEEMNATSDEIATATMSISDDAALVNTEANKAAELSDSLQQQMQKIHDNTTVLSSTAQTVDEVGSQAIQQIDYLDETNHSVQNKIQRMQEIMTKLEQDMVKIESIATFITNISGQTNLLALNASIEAARAGEHGKGFAVVADEVRKLAEQSAQAAADVQLSIQEILNQSKVATSEMQATNEQFSIQLNAVEKTTSAFQQMSQHVTDMLAAIHTIDEEVSSATSLSSTIQQQMHEILNASDQTLAATEQVTSSTLEQTEATKTVAMASEELLMMSQEMEQQIDQFKVGADGPHNE
ncbi:methyl-accepting chemotaxis protein [Metasolibacillus meyeri]|uniref:methyl-accepting chemotaxis protein n=1 Tax=Metasolibacillus meyeri TaxID=1071052 RepID=UPI000D30C42F|nr:methyl-accepting chemotaxis protein [Metasolibacillus meyeri]